MMLLNEKQLSKISGGEKSDFRNGFEEEILGSLGDITTGIFRGKDNKLKKGLGKAAGELTIAGIGGLICAGIVGAAWGTTEIVRHIKAKKAK